MVTYNVHWGEQVDSRTGRWTGRLDLARIAADIRRSGAEVAMLQELHTYRVEGRIVNEAREIAKLLRWTGGGVARHAYFQGSAPVAIWCRRATGRRVVKWIHGRPGRCRQHGNAILSRRPLVSARFVDLSRPAARDIYGATEGRGGILAAIDVSGQRVELATAHLAREPVVATCQLRDLLAQLSGRSPLVLAGDFNMEPGTETAAPYCSGVPPRPLDQLAALGFSRGEPGGRTYPAHRPREAIDHFFTSSGAAAEGVRPQSNCRGGRCSSDHRPLAATVSLPPRE